MQLKNLLKSAVLLLLAIFALDCTAHAYANWAFDGATTFAVVVWLAITIGTAWASFSALRSPRPPAARSSLRSEPLEPPPPRRLVLNTAQLIVLWYAGLMSVGVLLFRALTGSSNCLIAAIVLLAGLVIYTLKPHPARKRRVAAAVIVPPLLLGAALWGCLKHAQRIEAEREAAEATAEATKERATRAAQEDEQYAAHAAMWAKEQQAEARQREADAGFGSEIEAGVPREGRWLPVALGPDHSHYFVDLDTAEVVTAQPDSPWLMGAAFGTVNGTQEKPASLRLWVKATESSEAQRALTQLIVACQGHEMTPWTYTPGTVAETIDRWVEQSKWCRDAQARRQAQATISAERVKADKLKSPYVMGIDQCSHEFSGSALTACIQQKTAETRTIPTFFLCTDQVCCPVDHPSLGTDGNCHTYAVYPTSKEACERSGAGSKECELIWSSTGQTTAYRQ